MTELYYKPHCMAVNPSVCSDVVQVFGNLDLNPGEDIERHTNFRTFLAAVMLLFR